MDNYDQETPWHLSTPQTVDEFHSLLQNEMCLFYAWCNACVIINLTLVYSMTYDIRYPPNMVCMPVRYHYLLYSCIMILKSFFEIYNIFCNASITCVN